MGSINFLEREIKVTGVMASASYLCDVITQGEIDICGISEHWLSPNNLYFLDTISNDYNYHAVCDNDLYSCKTRKVGKGGVAILWNNRYDNYVVPLNIDSDRIVGIQLQNSPGDFVFIFQVYLPCSNHNIEKYNDCIALLYDLHSSFCDHGLTVCIGDFNARVFTPNYCTREKKNC